MNYSMNGRQSHDDQGRIQGHDSRASGLNESGYPTLEDDGGGFIRILELGTREYQRKYERERGREGARERPGGAHRALRPSALIERPAGGAPVHQFEFDSQEPRVLMRVVFSRVATCDFDAPRVPPLEVFPPAMQTKNQEKHAVQSPIVHLDLFFRSQELVWASLRPTPPRSTLMPTREHGGSSWGCFFARPRHSPRRTSN